MQQQVVIFSNHRLIADGIDSRFRQFPEQVNLHFVHIGDENRFELIAGTKPDTVIFIASDVGVKEYCLLGELISFFPKIKIILVAIDKDTVQVVFSKQSRCIEVRDLIDLI